MFSSQLSEALADGKNKKFCPKCKGKLWPDMASCDACGDYEADYDAMEPPESEMKPEPGDAPPATNDPVDGDGEEGDDETENLDEVYRGMAAHAKLQNKTRPHIEALTKLLGHHDYTSAVVYMATKVLRKKEWIEPAKAIAAASEFGSLNGKGGTAEGLWKKALAALKDKDWQDYLDYGWSGLEKL